MARTSKLVVWIAAAVCCWWLWNYSVFGDLIQSYVENGEIVTLEARYTPEQVMQAHHEELIPNDRYTFKEPACKYYPYLLLEVKYPQSNGKTKEGIILWSMVDGEMVIDANTWQKTHGFEDAINAGATASDFQILNTLAAYRGALVLPRLQSELGVDDQSMKKMLDSVVNKQLVIMRGTEAALHFQNPQFNIIITHR